MEQETQNSLAEDMKIYVGTKTELVRLGLVEKTAQFLSGTITQLILFLLLFIFLLFAGLTAAAYLRPLTGSMASALAIVTAFYFFVATIYFLVSGKLREKLQDRFISNMLHHEPDQE
jgi:hypothetical protein